MALDFSLGCAAGLLALGVLAVVLAGQRSATAIIYTTSLLLTLGLLANAILHLLANSTPETTILPLGLPWVGAHFRLDALAAAFLVIVNLGAAGASLYGLGYGRHEISPSRVLPFFPVFLAGMNLVVLADDAFSFLLSWEFMSLASWALVMAHHRVPENRHAGYVYILMASFGTLALLLAFGLLAGPEGNYAFAAIRSIDRAQGAWPVLVLVLIGAGSKAGLVPLHVWLPLAHPAAPSHVSALMSGVMTKVAVYAFVRIIFDLSGPPDWWWGLIVVSVGGGTAVMGVLYALMQNDLKRILAYSTIENVGIVFVGIGLAMAFQANALPDAAALAFTAALFHAFNHTLFKSLLFFGAGAVLTATGERNMEHLGGLIHRMPVTSIAVLTGCVAISALPPLNGFASEWLTFQAILLSPELPQWGLKIMVPANGALLALAAALAAACFIRLFGISFLGRPRTPVAEQAHEVDIWSRTAMTIFAILCLLVGALPGFVIDALAPVVQGVTGSHMPAQTTIDWFSIVPIASSRSSYNGLLVLLFIALSAALTAYLVHLVASKSVRRAPAWDCGFPDPSPLTQYSAVSFAQPIRRVFGTLVFHVSEHVSIPPPGDTSPARFRVDLRDLVWDFLYAPIAGTINIVADGLNVLQFLTIRRYLSLVFLALVSLLLVLAIWS
jgi:formate hydrogenlyase subunit 3/multisubunit Na+/H+ antiporter MnhD subunit